MNKFFKRNILLNKYFILCKKKIKIDGINNAPEEFYKGKEVCITGKIELYKDKPQIVVTSKSQIVEQIIDKVDDKEPK